MVVWVEDVIIDNLIIDTLILLTVNNFAKLNAKKWRLFLSATFGTIIALISPLLPNFINLIAKPFVSVIMVILCFDIKNIKKFFAIYLLFFLTTFAYGGASIGICEMLGINYKISNQFYYQNQVPVGVIILICAFVYFCLKNIIKFCFFRHKFDGFQYQIIIENCGKKINICAFLDSGNLIEYNKKPITIINYQTFCKIYPKIKFEDVLLKRKINIKNAEYIEIKSLENMKEKMLVFQVEKLTIKNKHIDNAVLGLSLKNFSGKLQSDAIISNKILEMGV